MKKLLIAIAAVLVSVASYAQGTVAFNTRITGVLDAPVELQAPGGNGPGPTYTAELVLVGTGGSITPIPQSVTTFRTVPAGGNPLLAKYVNTVSTVEVPGTTVGGSATLRFRAYLTSAGSYDAAGVTQRGASTDFTVTGLGGAVPGAPSLPAANLVGITGFVIPIPEPSTITLGVLGAAALLLRRRK